MMIASSSGVGIAAVVEAVDPDSVFHPVDHTGGQGSIDPLLGDELVDHLGTVIADVEQADPTSAKPATHGKSPCFAVTREVHEFSPPVSADVGRRVCRLEC